MSTTDGRNRRGAGGSEPASRIEQVASTLRKRILCGEFLRGERLVELTLVSQVDASRTPVRLALERLAHQGLLEASPSGGFRVREFTITDVWDAIELRGVLEGTAARLAAERLRHRREVEPLRECHESFAAIAATELDGFLEYVGRNMAYHQALWKLAKSPMLERAIEGVCAIPFASPAMVFGNSEVVPVCHTRTMSIDVEHHRAILEAIEGHEGARAESLAREHARLSRYNVDWALHHPELFPSLPGGHLVVLPGVEKPVEKRARVAG